MCVGFQPSLTGLVRFRGCNPGLSSGSTFRRPYGTLQLLPAFASFSDMKRLLWFLPMLMCCAGVRAQNIEGQIIASQYGKWKVTGSTVNAFLINVYAPGGAVVSGAYNSAVTSGNVILTIQKRRV